MLVLDRQLGERRVGPHGEPAVTVSAVNGKTVRPGIPAPEDRAVYREEVRPQLCRETPANGRADSGLTTERSFMNDNRDPAREHDTRLETFAAELTGAACALAFRHGVKGSWIQVELDLWTALAETVRKWGRDRPAESGDDLEAWRAREDLLLDLTEIASSITLQHGIEGPVLEVKLELYRTFRWATRRHNHARPAE